MKLIPANLEDSIREGRTSLLWQWMQRGWAPGTCWTARARFASVRNHPFGFCGRGFRCRVHRWDSQLICRRRYSTMASTTAMSAARDEIRPELQEWADDLPDSGGAGFRGRCWANWRIVWGRRRACGFAAEFLSTRGRVPRCLCGCHARSGQQSRLVEGEAGFSTSQPVCGEKPSRFQAPGSVWSELRHHLRLLRTESRHACASLASLSSDQGARHHGKKPASRQFMASWGLKS